MQNLVVVSHTVCAHVRAPKFGGGDAGAPPLEMGTWLTPIHMLLLTYVTTPNSVTLGQIVRM